MLDIADSSLYFVSTAKLFNTLILKHIISPIVPLEDYQFQNVHKMYQLHIKPLQSSWKINN